MANGAIILLISMIFTHGTQASFHLRSASEELQQLKAETNTADLDPTANGKILKALDIDWWFWARSTAISIIILVTLVVGLCVCIKFGEGKQAEKWDRWETSQEVQTDHEKWNEIERRMQKADVASYVEATDYQQFLKNVAQRVGRDKIAEDSQAGAMRCLIAKTFRLNEMSNAAGAVLQSMPATEAMHWLQLQPKPFQG